MRKWLYAMTLGLLASSGAGCILPAYSGDPAQRSQELIYTSENLRMLVEEWERFWLLDQPNHMSPIRTHGGIVL